MALVSFVYSSRSQGLFQSGGILIFGQPYRGLAFQCRKAYLKVATFLASHFSGLASQYREAYLKVAAFLASHCRSLSSRRFLLFSTSMLKV